MRRFRSDGAIRIALLRRSATGGPLDEFATRHSFEPLGITKTEWRRGPSNRTAGQGSLRRLGDMARIGEMVLREGMTNGGAKLLERLKARGVYPYSDVDRRPVASELPGGTTQDGGNPQDRDGPNR